MINGVSNYGLSSELTYLDEQIQRLSPGKFTDCSKSMLILGCGDGTAVNKMALTHPDWSFTGVDFNHDYIGKARASSPDNVRYIESSFSDLSLDREYGVVGSCGLLSWIEPDQFDAVINISKHCVERGGYASFGFDNEFFWAELKAVRELFLSLWVDLGCHEQAGRLTRVFVDSMKFTTEVKHLFAKQMLTDDIELRHWLLQPHWSPMYPSKVIMSMRKAGFGTPEEFVSLADMATNCISISRPYIHWDLKKL